MVSGLIVASDTPSSWPSFRELNVTPLLVLPRFNVTTLLLPRLPLAPTLPLTIQSQSLPITRGQWPYRSAGTVSETKSD